MANYGAGLSGLASGATTGAQLGSFFGPWGTAIGGTLGGLAGGIGGLSSGGGSSQKQRPMQNQMGQQGMQGNGLQNFQGQFGQLQNFTPQQQQVLSQLLSQGSQGLQNPYEGFAPIEQQARNQFQSQTIPSLAERFTGMGGGQRSSAFQGALGNAASGLETGLAGLRSQYGFQNRNQLLQMLQMGLQPQFENLYSPQQPSFWEQIAPGFGQALGQLGSTAIQYGGQSLYNKYGQAPVAGKA